MKRLLVYLAPIVALIATLIALLGESHLEGASGLSSLTALGWVSAVLAVLSTVIVLVSIYSSQRELAEARQNQARIHAVAHQGIQRGINHLKEVLKFACLIRYIATPYHAKEDWRDYPYEQNEKGGYIIDLRSKEALEDLSVFYLHPKIKLRGPYVPSVIPFGTDVVRPVLTIVADESAKAKEMIEVAFQMYSANPLSPEIYEKASELLDSLFLAHLIGLNDFWQKRYRMEGDCNVPEITLVSVVDSGHTGGYKRDYLAMLDSIEELETAMRGHE